MSKSKVTKFNFRTKEVRDLSVTAAEASKSAIKESAELGLTVRVIDNQQVIEILPSGGKHVVKFIEQVKTVSRLKKGMVLWRR